MSRNEEEELWRQMSSGKISRAKYDKLRARLLGKRGEDEWRHGHEERLRPSERKSKKRAEPKPRPTREVKPSRPRQADSASAELDVQERSRRLLAALKTKQGRAYSHRETPTTARGVERPWQIWFCVAVLCFELLRSLLESHHGYPLRHSFGGIYYLLVNGLLVYGLLKRRGWAFALSLVFACLALPFSLVTRGVIAAGLNFAFVLALWNVRDYFKTRPASSLTEEDA